MLDHDRSRSYIWQEAGLLGAGKLRNLGGSARWYHSPRFALGRADFGATGSGKLSLENATLQASYRWFEVLPTSDIGTHAFNVGILFLRNPNPIDCGHQLCQASFQLARGGNLGDDFGV